MSILPHDQMLCSLYQGRGKTNLWNGKICQSSYKSTKW